MRNGWAVRFEGYDPEDEGRREALCTVGNGYVATRGASSHGPADGVHYPGTYGAGIYNRRTSEVAGRAVDNEDLVNLPNWLLTPFRIDGGAWFAPDAVELLEHLQEMDLRRAVLTRRSRFRDDRGRTTTIIERRFVSMQDEHACALELTFVPEDWSGRLEVRSLLDGSVENTLVKRYRALDGCHLMVRRAEEFDAESVLLEVETNQSGIRVAMAARSTLWSEGEPVTPTDRYAVGEGGAEGGVVGHHVTLEVREGVAVTLEKVVTVFTSRDRAISEPALEATRWLHRMARFEELLEGHVVAWRHLWERFHVDLEGHDRWLCILRLHLLHVLQSVSMNSVDLDVGVPARGLHGEAYRGHVFWDELFVFPVLNLRLPLLTRALLRYRHRRLAEARAAAVAEGYAGAMFPWQSGSNGEEENQRLHLNPVSGRWRPDPTHRQRHVGLAIAYNVWQYYEGTGDREFLSHYGAEMLLEIARFFSSLATYDHGRGRYVIRGVMGPDEFHTGYPGHEEGIDNNAYTNVLAAWVLRRALECLDLLADHTRHELWERLGLTAEECSRWDDMTRRLFVPFHEDGIMSQFEGYEALAELDWEGYRRKYGDIHRLDRILDAEGDSVNRYKASKQADVLMLFHLLSADELREVLERLDYRLDPEDIPRTIHYYLDRTSHGSTLSAVVHAWVLARAERERAVEFLELALESDIADIQGGTTAEAIHLAAMAGSVDLFQRCFSGLETRHGRLELNPYWPESLGTLEFAIRYREHPLTLRIHGGGVEVLSAPGRQPGITVACRGVEAELEPGSRLRFPA